jgi:hypothetical protein
MSFYIIDASVLNEDTKFEIINTVDEILRSEDFDK